MWLFIWILLFFSIFCIWSKLPAFTENKEVPAPTHVQAPIKKQIYFKLLKDHDSVLISGIVPSKEAEKKIVDAYEQVFQTVHHNNLHVDPEAQEDHLVEFFANFAENFSHFDSGYLGFSNNTLEIDGSVQDKALTQELQTALHQLESHIQINNTVSLHEVTTPNEGDKAQESSDTKIDIQKVQEELDTLLDGKRIQFLYAREILTKQSAKLLDSLINVLKKYPDIKIEVAGHTDSDGTKKRNLHLSQKRADSVKAYMVKKGLNQENINAVGYGEAYPLVNNDTLTNRRLNRRVEFKIIGK